MFCEFCGKNIADDSRFCEFCGGKVTPMMPTDNAAAAQPAAPQPTPAQQVAPQAGPVPQQQYQQVGQVQGAPQPAPAPQPKAPKQPMSAEDKQGLISIIAAAGAIVLAFVFIIVFVGVGNSLNSPKKVAKSFYNAYVSGNYAGAYEYLDVTESEYINAETFAASQAYRTTDSSNRINYATVSYGTGRKTATVYVDGSNYSGEISLKRVGGFHIFPKWKVDSSEYVISDMSIYTYEGATPVFDGEEVAESYQNGTDGDYVVYTIPKIFVGTHSFATNYGDFEGMAEQVTLAQYDASYYCTSMKMSQEQQEQLISDAYTIFTKVNETCVMGNDVSNITDYYTGDALNSIKNDFDEEYSSFYMLGEYTTSKEYKGGITGLALTNVEGSVDDIYMYADGLYATIDFKFDCQTEYIDCDYDWNGHDYKYSYNKKNYNYSDGATLYLVYTDGSWKLSSCYYPYYYTY